MTNGRSTKSSRRAGLIAQVTDEEQVRDLVNNGKATFYIGFDCTADSLTRRPLHGAVP